MSKEKTMSDAKCPVTPQELRARARNIVLSGTASTQLLQHVEDLLQIADYLEKPAPAAGSEPTRGAEPLQTIREDRVCARCGATVSHDCGPAAPPTAQARPKLTREKVLEATVRRLEAELAEVRESYPTLEPCGHPKNFLMGDEHGHSICTVCERDQAREQRDTLVKALRKVDGMVVSSFDGPRGGPAHQIHAEIQSTLAALEKEQG